MSCTQVWLEHANPVCPRFKPVNVLPDSSNKDGKARPKEKISKLTANDEFARSHPRACQKVFASLTRATSGLAKSHLRARQKLN